MTTRCALLICLVGPIASNRSAAIDSIVPSPAAEPTPQLATSLARGIERVGVEETSHSRPDSPFDRIMLVAETTSHLLGLVVAVVILTWCACAVVVNLVNECCEQCHRRPRGSCTVPVNHTDDEAPLCRDKPHPEPTLEFATFSIRHLTSSIFPDCDDKTHNLIDELIDDDMHNGNINFVLARLHGLRDCTETDQSTGDRETRYARALEALLKNRSFEDRVTKEQFSIHDAMMLPCCFEVLCAQMIQRCSGVCPFCAAQVVHAHSANPAHR